MWAVVHKSPGCLRLLLDMGASTDGRYKDGQTVGETARDRGNTEVIRVLEEYSRRTGELDWCFVLEHCLLVSVVDMYPV